MRSDAGRAGLRKDVAATRGGDRRPDQVPRNLSMVMVMMVVVVVSMVQRFGVRADGDDRQQQRNDERFEFVHGDTFWFS